MRSLFSTFMLVALTPLGFAEEKAVRFDPVKKTIEGWTVHVEPALLEGEHAEAGARCLRMLGDHLNRISILMPKERLAELRKLEIWIEWNHPKLKSMQYHPSAGWLKSHGHDLRLAEKVHIPVATALIDRRQLVKHPMVILHELAHSYHDQVLSFDHKKIIAAFARAEESKKYEKVLLYTGRKVRHYGLTNHKEYFAEGTEAYFGRNDFYPFVRAELKEFDPGFHDVLEEIWGRVR